MAKIKYPVGIQSFEKIRKGEYLYVDKTQYIYNLVTEGEYYFISRPRRFGKSLLLSTLESFFSGRRELFEGLAISNEEWGWEEYPVLHLDLNVRNYQDIESLESILERHLEDWEQKYSITEISSYPEDRFIRVIKTAHEQTGRQVVILIDEYDKPLLAHLDDMETLEKSRNILAAFYGVLKSLDRHIRFAMLTGVTRFGKLSVFSGLNNLQDITLAPQYSALCGISQMELEEYFTEGIDELANISKTTDREILQQLKKNYDGYHFSESMVDVYNPFSLLNTFAQNRFRKFWFETGTPTFLVNLLKKHNYELSHLEGARCTESQLLASDQYRTNPVPMFFQSGYLTIKKYESRFMRYTLGYPNAEVEEGLLEFLLPYYTSEKISRDNDLYELVEDVEDGHAEDFLVRLKSFFSGFPYDQIPDLEVHYQNVIYIITKLMGFYVRTEYKTSDGRIDLLIETDRYVYVIECKLNDSAESALNQIEEKGYADPFAASGKTVFKIGIAFDRTKRTIGNWLIK